METSIDITGHSKLKKLLHGKGNNQHCKEKAWGMGEKSLPGIHLTED
jgi:hypothetical protein